MQQVRDVLQGRLHLLREVRREMVDVAVVAKELTRDLRGFGGEGLQNMGIRDLDAKTDFLIGLKGFIERDLVQLQFP